MSIFDDQDAVRRPLEGATTCFCKLAGFFFICCAMVVCFSLIFEDELTAHLTVASVSNFSISNPSGPTSTITGTWLLTLAIDNNGGGGVSMYPGIQSRVFYGIDELAQARTAPFSLGNWRSTDITIRLATSEFYIDPEVAEQMNEDWMSLGTVEFDFIASVIGDKIDYPGGMDISCLDIPFKFIRDSTGNGSSGEYIGSPWKCER